MEQSKSIKEILDTYGKYTGLTMGTSMKPLIHEQRDNIIVVKNKGRLKKYDVPVYVTKQGKYIMHRIVEVCDDHYVIVGDNLTKKEYVTDDMICGVLVGFYKDGKNISIAKTLRLINFIPRFGLLFCLFVLLFFFSQEGLIGLKGIFSKRGDVYLWLKKSAKRIKMFLNGCSLFAKSRCR